MSASKYEWASHQQRDSVRASAGLWIFSSKIAPLAEKVAGLARPRTCFPANTASDCEHQCQCQSRISLASDLSTVNNKPIKQSETEYTKDLHAIVLMKLTA